MTIRECSECNEPIDEAEQQSIIDQIIGLAKTKTPLEHHPYMVFSLVADAWFDEEPYWCTKCSHRDGKIDKASEALVDLAEDIATVMPNVRQLTTGADCHG